MDRRAKQAFDNAIAAAKGEIPSIIKNRAVDFTNKSGQRTRNYRYEDFAAVAAAVDPVLARHGLSYRFRTEQTGPKLRVTCRISHAAGYGEETTLEATNDDSGNKNAIQAVGSAATYLQRYTLKLALGLAASNDDDAQSVGGADAGLIDTDQLVQMQDLLKETNSNLELFFLAIGATGFSTRPDRQAVANRHGEAAREAAQGAGEGGAAMNDTPGQGLPTGPLRLGWAHRTCQASSASTKETGYGASRSQPDGSQGGREDCSRRPSRNLSGAQPWLKGLEREPLARAAYAFLHDVEVELHRADRASPCQLKGSHASPDRLIGLQGLLEKSKCPPTGGAPRHIVGPRRSPRTALPPNPVATLLRLGNASGRISVSFNPRLPGADAILGDAN